MFSVYAKSRFWKFVLYSWGIKISRNICAEKMDRILSFLELIGEKSKKMGCSTQLFQHVYSKPSWIKNAAIAINDSSVANLDLR